MGRGGHGGEERIGHGFWKEVGIEGGAGHGMGDDTGAMGGNKDGVRVVNAFGAGWGETRGREREWGMG